MSKLGPNATTTNNNNDYDGRAAGQYFTLPHTVLQTPECHKEVTFRSPTESARVCQSLLESCRLHRTQVDLYARK